MTYTDRYLSPLGGITLASDGESLTGLWFDGQKYFGSTLGERFEERADAEVFCAVKGWLDIYFDGREPDFTPPLGIGGSPFRRRVLRQLLQIPYGRTATYGELAAALAEESGRPVSAQAVGGAVGHNPISIIVPCHRVVGRDGSLTGYAGGVDKKLRLLTLERADVSRLFAPKRGSAL